MEFIAVCAVAAFAFFLGRRFPRQPQAQTASAADEENDLVDDELAALNRPRDEVQEETPIVRDMEEDAIYFVPNARSGCYHHPACVDAEQEFPRLQCGAPQSRRIKRLTLCRLS